MASAFNAGQEHRLSLSAGGMYFGQAPPQTVIFPGAFLGAIRLYSTRPKSAWKTKKTLMKWVSFPQLEEEARLNPLTTAEVMVGEKGKRANEQVARGHLALYTGYSLGRTPDVIE